MDEPVVLKWIQMKSKNIAKSSLKAFFYSLVIMLDIVLESMAMMFLGSILLLIGF